MRPTWIQFLIQHADQIDIRVSLRTPNTFEVNYAAQREHEVEFVHCLQGPRNVDHSPVTDWEAGPC